MKKNLYFNLCLSYCMYFCGIPLIPQLFLKFHSWGNLPVEHNPKESLESNFRLRFLSFYWNVFYFR